jgi:hypothetical protein
MNNETRRKKLERTRPINWRVTIFDRFGHTVSDNATFENFTQALMWCALIETGYDLGGDDVHRIIIAPDTEER